MQNWFGMWFKSSTGEYQEQNATKRNIILVTLLPIFSPRWKHARLHGAAATISIDGKNGLEPEESDLSFFETYTVSWWLPACIIFCNCIFCSQYGAWWKPEQHFYCADLPHPKMTRNFFWGYSPQFVRFQSMYNIQQVFFLKLLFAVQTPPLLVMYFCKSSIKRSSEHSFCALS